MTLMDTGWLIDGFGGVYTGYSVGHRNLEGIMFLWFCLSRDLCLSTHVLRESKGGKLHLDWENMR